MNLSGHLTKQGKQGKQTKAKPRQTKAGGKTGPLTPPKPKLPAKAKPKTRKKAQPKQAPVPTEHVEQRNFVQWFRILYPDVRIFAIPNGGWRTPATAARLKAEGLAPGVPDLFIPAWRLFIEMKRTRGGRLSAEQTDWMGYLKQIGYSVEVCAGADEGKALVAWFLNDVGIKAVQGAVQGAGQEITDKVTPNG